LGPDGEDGFGIESVFRKPGLSPKAKSGPFFGGDRGGSTSTDGGCTGLGLTVGGARIGRLGDVKPLLVGGGTCKLGMLFFSFGLLRGTGGGSREMGGADAVAPASRSLSGFGEGETARGVGGAATVDASWVPLFMFSNLARSDDTGL
jgi:hypothetical protein